MNNKTMMRSVFSAAAVCLLAACSLKPEYQRPALPVKSTWDTQANVGMNASETHWESFFMDKTLRGLISQALKNNRDLKVAALNVETARAQAGIATSNILPTFNAQASKTSQHLPGGLYSTQSSGPVTYQQYQGNIAVSSWELDFFGRLRDLREQALEKYLASDATRQATQISLVSSVAESYLSLCADSDLHRIAKSTVKSQQESYRLAQTRFRAGLVTEQDILQAETAVKSAEADIAKYERQRQQDINALRLLVGSELSLDVAKEATLEKSWAFPSLNAGLPSAVLTRRPDIISAEHSLKAENANIGAARAAFFPSISLTASGGSASGSLGHLFNGGTGAWSFTPSINLPIFDGGKNQAQLDVAKAANEIAVANYEKAIQQAFKEVSDALSGKATYVDEVKARKDDLQVNQRYYQLANLRYERGVDDYLNVLTAQRSLYSSEVAYINVISSSVKQDVTLYKVLGGGWEQ